MMTRLSPTCAFGSLAALLSTLSMSFVSNAAECKTQTNPLYVTGSSAIKPLIAKLAPALSAATPPMTIVYKGQGSCTGVEAIVNGTKITGTAALWDGAGAEQTCTLDLTGNSADIGVSDVFAASCPGITNLPSDVSDFFGPVQVMTFVVPKASSQNAISAEAAYFVFGFGQPGQAAPWTDENFLFRRNDQSGTQQMIGRAIQVPANKWKGKDAGGSGAVLTAVASAAQPDAALGILATDVADGSRDKIKVLAYQHTGQSCAYWPDSSATTFDKASVRDGHYPIWGPLHLFSKVGTDKKPVNASAAKFVGFFTGEVAPPSAVSLIDLEIAAHTIPQCAMHVTRTTELGALMSHQPSEPCGCYFEFKATGKTSCTACANDSACPATAPTCRLGYCEVK